VFRRLHGRIIIELTGVDAVAITDRETVLAHVGLGADHHLPGHPFLTESTARVLEQGTVEVAQSKPISAAVRRLPLESGVVVPLFCQNRIVGSLKLYRARADGITRWMLRWHPFVPALFHPAGIG